MAVHQRDVYILPHPFDSSVPFHPFIVLSVNEANVYESTFIGVMITSSETRFDDFSFALTNEMFEKELPKKDSHVRMHLLTLCLTEEIQGNQDRSINRMKPEFFKQLMASIGDLIFNYEFTQLP
jgi:hypothetical protein